MAYRLIKGGESLKFNVPAGESRTLKLDQSERPTVAAVPGGNTASVEYSVSNPDDIDNDSAIWHNWASGDVTETTVDGLAVVATGIRFSATGGPVDFEIAL